MTDLTNLLMEWYEGVRASNAIQTAMMTIGGGAIMGILIYLLKDLPIRIKNWIVYQSTTTLAFNSQSVSWGNYNQQQYVAFLLWLSHSSWFKRFSRVLTIDAVESWGKDGYKQHQGIGPGLGRHWFRFNGKFYVATVTEKESQGTNISKFNLSITCLGRSHKPLTDLMDAFVEKTDEEENTVKIFKNGKEGWDKITEAVNRPIESVVIEDGIIDGILEKIREFESEKEWYLSMGINYKIAFLLYGIPGTGKTSLIRAIAGVINRPIYNYVPNYDLDTLPGLLARAKGGIVCIEDIDSYSMASTRESIPEIRPEAKPDKKSKELKPFGGGELVPCSNDTTSDGDETATETLKKLFSSDDLPKLLNAIDGVVGLDDVVLFITTNHPEKLDAALTRDGRIDFKVEIPPMSNATIRKYAKRCYGELIDVELITGNNIPGATVQTAFNLNRRDYDGFVTYLNNHVHKQVIEIEAKIDKVA